MGIEAHRHGFRARVKKGHRTFSGPVRESEAAARQDEIEYKQAAADSLETLQKLHDEMLSGLSVPIQKHNNGWRARIIKDGNKLEQLEVVYQQWGSGIPKKHLIRLILIILSCC